MSETQIWNTCREFDLNQDGLVDYRLFVDYMRKKTIADAVLRYSRGRKITSGHMKRILRKPAKLTMPDTIRGTKLEETRLTMMYSRADLKIEGDAADSLDDGGSDDNDGGTPRYEALEIVPAEKLARYDARVTEAFCALSEYIISQIIEEMENAQGAALGTSGWNRYAEFRTVPISHSFTHSSLSLFHTRKLPRSKATTDRRYSQDYGAFA